MELFYSYLKFQESFSNELKNFNKDSVVFSVKGQIHNISSSSEIHPLLLSTLPLLHWQEKTRG